MVIEGKEVKAVQELPWYAGGLAYRLGCDRRFIRKQPHLVSPSSIASIPSPGGIIENFTANPALFEAQAGNVSYGIYRYSNIW